MESSINIQKGRVGLSALLGAGVLGGLGALAENSQAVAARLNSLASIVSSEFIKLAPQITKGAAQLAQMVPVALANHPWVLTGGLAVAGLGLGAILGKASAPIASDLVKKQLHMEGSDLSAQQLHHVANISVRGGIFTPRTMKVQAKDLSLRIKNLDDALTKVEQSLSKSADQTSQAGSNAVRFFDFEAKMLTRLPQSTEEFLTVVKTLENGIQSTVKATDKYTYQQGNSATSVSRRDYMRIAILDLAHQNGIAEKYLAIAAKERMETLQNDVQLADANFKQAILRGIETKILAPQEDAKFYVAMVHAAGESVKASIGQNPDSTISSLFDLMASVGAIDNQYLPKFIQDVRAQLINAGVEIVNPPVEPSRLQRLMKWFERKPETAAPEEVKAPVEKVLTEQEKADIEVNGYVAKLAQLVDRWATLQAFGNGTVMPKLQEIHQNLNRALQMGNTELVGALSLAHQGKLDILENIEKDERELDLLKLENQAQFTQLKQESRDAYIQARPANFKLASKEQKRLARQAETQLKQAQEQYAKMRKEVGNLYTQILSAHEQYREGENRVRLLMHPMDQAIILPKVKRTQTPFITETVGAEETLDQLMTEEMTVPEPVIS